MIRFPLPLSCFLWKTGMRHAYGKPQGTTARVSIGQVSVSSKDVQLVFTAFLHSLYVFSVWKWRYFHGDITMLFHLLCNFLFWKLMNFDVFIGWDDESTCLLVDELLYFWCRSVKVAMPMLFSCSDHHLHSLEG